MGRTRAIVVAAAPRKDEQVIRASLYEAMSFQGPGMLAKRRYTLKAYVLDWLSCGAFSATRFVTVHKTQQASAAASCWLQGAPCEAQIALKNNGKALISEGALRGK